MVASEPMRLLVVDDNDDAAMTMAFLLKRFGHESLVATDSEIALEKAPSFHPDAMFIDLSMPRIDGLGMARVLRAMPDFSGTPLVAVSGYTDPERRAEALAAGFDEFLAKPYPLAELLAILNRISPRIDQARRRAQEARKAATDARQLVQESRRKLSEFWQSRRVASPAAVSVEKSGIANVLSLDNAVSAGDLRRWLKLQGCRVGPVFEPTTGQFCFYVYSKRHCIREIIGKNGGFTVEQRPKPR
jgi:CheY-like chemotaxis protein